jgi:membrane protein
VAPCLPGLPGVPGYLDSVKKIFSDWNKHEAPRMGAALAFYTILSLSPLLVLAVGIAGLLFDRTLVTKRILAEVEGLIGSGAAQALSQAFNSASQKAGHGIIASAVSVVILLASASGVFGELRTTLNKIWDVPPDDKGGIWTMIRDEVFSFGMVLAVGFLLLASLLISAALAAFTTFLNGALPIPGPVATVFEVLISTIGIGLVFALMFRYVPSAPTSWRQTILGGLLTAILFAVGKYLIGLYLAKAAVGSAYGAAGSVIVVIVWVYYTAQIVFFGAEFTHFIGQRDPVDQKDFPTGKTAPSRQNRT